MSGNQDVTVNVPPSSRGKVAGIAPGSLMNRYYKGSCAMLKGGANCWELGLGLGGGLGLVWLKWGSRWHCSREPHRPLLKGIMPRFERCGNLLGVRVGARVIVNVAQVGKSLKLQQGALWTATTRDYVSC